MEKIATATYSFEKVIGEANGTDEPEMIRTAVVRTAAVSAAGAGQRRARYHAAVETAAVRRRRRRYGIGQYGARSDFSEAN